MKKTSRSTSYDVARLAGVSQSAVSRCFKPGASISPAMRERVMKAARELGYQPNAMARGLITKRSGLMAVLVSSTMNFYYPEVLFQLTQRLADAGMRVLLFAVDTEGEAAEAIDRMWQYSVDGVISASHLSLPQYELLSERGIPVVLFNRWFAERKSDSVYSDADAAIGELVDDLVAGGHSRFALISGPARSMVGFGRADAYRAALARHDLSFATEAQGDFQYASGAQAADAILGAAAPTAILSVNDMMAMGAIDRLRHHHGVRVPGDISVSGIDGVASGQFDAYRLTTIRQPIGRMAEAAVAILLERLEREDGMREVRVLDCTLNYGGSTGPAPTPATSGISHV